MADEFSASWRIWRFKRLFKKVNQEKGRGISEMKKRRLPGIEIPRQRLVHLACEFLNLEINGHLFIHKTLISWY